MRGKAAIGKIVTDEDFRMVGLFHLSVRMTCMQFVSVLVIILRLGHSDGCCQSKNRITGYEVPGP